MIQLYFQLFFLFSSYFIKCVRTTVGNSVCIPVVTLQVRLVNGSLDEEGRVEGRLEVLLNNVWGTVCDDIWNTNNAQVVCRMLGYDGSAEATANAYFGKGVGQIWMDDVSCNGNEQSLTGCPFS
nr:scavenger receptor class A member 5-like [Crassostrea gigas]